jgi:hypothetical protein
LAAYPPAERTKVSSPFSAIARNSSEAEPPIAPDIALTITYSKPSRSKMLMYACRCRSYERCRPSSSMSNEYESFMMNSRPRSTPARGRASSRYLFWIWYRNSGRSLYEEYMSFTTSANISSWVGPSR